MARYNVRSSKAGYYISDQEDIKRPGQDGAISLQVACNRLNNIPQYAGKLLAELGRKLDAKNKEIERLNAHVDELGEQLALKETDGTAQNSMD